jgi:hypothetical protein
MWRSNLRVYCNKTSVQLCSCAAQLFPLLDPLDFDHILWSLNHLHSFTASCVPPIMAFNAANLALDGGDPRIEKNPALFALDNGLDTKGGELAGRHGFTVEAAHVHNDTEVLFEEYLHYSKLTRAEERAYEGNHINRKDPWSLGGIIKNRFSKGHVHEVNAVVDAGAIITTHNNATTVTDLEWRQASRALRTASWGSIFFLITTDILGPQGAAYVLTTHHGACNFQVFECGLG